MSNLLDIPGVAYSRVGNATAWRSDGTLQEFAPNQPRITDLGIMIENQRTNLDPWSRNNPGWTGNGTTPPTTQADITEDGRRCVSVTFPAGSDVGYGGCRAEISSVINRATIQAGNTYTWSAEIKLSRQLVSGESLRVYYTGSAGVGLITIDQSNQKAGWYRISTSQTVVASGTVGIVPYVSGAMLSPLTLFITNKQLETGSYATTPIITTGAVATVSRDTFYLGDMQQQLAQPWTVLVDVDGRGWEGVLATKAVLSVGVNNSGADRIAIFASGDNGGLSLQLRSGGQQLATISTPNQANMFKVAVTFNGSSYRMSRAGQAVVSIPATGFASPVTSLFPGGLAGSPENAKAPVRSTQFFPFSMTDADLVRLTQ